VIRRFLLFALAGAAGTPAHYLTMILLVEIGHVGAVVGAVAGSTVGGLVNYLLNRRYTFESARPYRETGPKFAVIATGTGALNALLVYLGADVLRLHYLAAQVIATLIVFFANFLLNSAWTFREEDPS
jgi:putative flippase GtrA